MSEMPTPTRKILDAWFSQKPTCALMGEYSAGKSTLLNLLLGGEVLLTQVTATNMPVVWMTYGEKAQGQALGRDGTLEAFDIDALGDAAHKDKLLLRLEMPIEILKRMDIIDTPGISDPRLAQGALEFLGPYLDFVIWCSAANQAWRQTERAMWSSMPHHLRDVSIMVLTRADTMRKASDLNKVVSRCEKEAGDLFRAFAPVATINAIAALDSAGAIVDSDVWDKSHAAPFYEVLEASIAPAIAACATRENLTVPQAEKVEAAPRVDQPKQVVNAKPEKAESPSKKKPAPKMKSPKASPKSMPQKVASAKPNTKKKAASKNVEATAGATQTSKISSISELSSEVYALRQADDTTSSKEPLFNTLDHLFTTFLCETKLSDAHQLVLSQVMSLERSKDLPHNKVILQLVQELEDFAEAPWCRLD